MKLHPDLEGKEFTYDDILLLPGKTHFEAGDVDLTAKLTKNMVIKLPFLSAPMDTVTESKMAIALALHGGVGVVHYNFYDIGIMNFEDNIERQRRELEKVKRFENGFIEDPITLSQNNKVDDALKIKSTMGFSHIPVTEDGHPHSKLMGAIDENCFRKAYLGKSIREVMFGLDEIIVSTWNNILGMGRENPLSAANDILLRSRKGILHVTDDIGNLIYLVTGKDIEKNEEYPSASKDRSKKLIVGAAIESRYDLACQRLEAIKKYIDFVVIDTSHGYIDAIGRMIPELQKRFRLDIIAGNVSTGEAAEFLIASGVDAVKVGTGSGSICTTIENIGVGRQQGIAVYECSKAAAGLREKYGFVPVIADGGIKRLGDPLKALALGADSVMMGSMFAGYDEAPGEVKDGFKTYRGMGSKDAMMQGGAVRYGVEKMKERVEEGVSVKIPYQGAVKNKIRELRSALMQGMHKAGARTIDELHEKAVIAPLSKTESVPHIYSKIADLNNNKK